MPMIIIRNDITKMKIDTIVNAANIALKMGGGVCEQYSRPQGTKSFKRNVTHLENAMLAKLSSQVAIVFQQSILFIQLVLYGTVATRVRQIRYIAATLIH